MKFSIKEFIRDRWQIIKDYFYRIEFNRWEKRLLKKCKSCPWWTENLNAKAHEKRLEEAIRMRKVEDEMLLNTQQVASYLQMTTSTIQQLAREKVIPSFRIRNRYLFRKDLLEKWLANSNNNSNEGDDNYESGY